jgi:hypothetical protein
MPVRPAGAIGHSSGIIRLAGNEFVNSNRHFEPQQYSPVISGFPARP